MMSIAFFNNFCEKAEKHKGSVREKQCKRIKAITLKELGAAEGEMLHTTEREGAMPSRPTSINKAKSTGWWAR